MDSRTIAANFAAELYSKFKGLVKTVVLVGSVAKSKEKKGSDIDVVIIVDNVSTPMTKELTDYYRLELGKLILSKKDYKRIHATTLTLTSVWDSIRVGEPAVINFLRVGIPLIDELNFFEPMRKLLAAGKIRPSEEAVFNAMMRAPYHLNRLKMKLFGVVEDLYWAMVDATHAVVMKHGYSPPSPEVMTKYMRKIKFFKENDIKLYNEVKTLMKKIVHVQLKDVDLSRLKVLRQRVEKFVQRVEKEIKKKKF